MSAGRINLEANAAGEAAQDYVRQARRLRHQLRHAPVRLHRSLRALRPVAARIDTAKSERVTFERGENGLTNAAPSKTEPNDRFAESVARSLESSTLRYSRRLQLLREADRLGIERFEANLIIAMVQHQLRGQATETIERATPVAPWLVFAVVQASILLIAIAFWVSLKS